MLIIASIQKPYHSVRLLQDFFFVDLRMPVEGESGYIDVLKQRFSSEQRCPW